MVSPQSPNNSPDASTPRQNRNQVGNANFPGNRGGNPYLQSFPVGGPGLAQPGQHGFRQDGHGLYNAPNLAYQQQRNNNLASATGLYHPQNFNAQLAGGMGRPPNMPYGQPLVPQLARGMDAAAQGLQYQHRGIDVAATQALQPQLAGGMGAAVNVPQAQPLGPQMAGANASQAQGQAPQLLTYANFNAAQSAMQTRNMDPKLNWEGGPLGDITVPMDDAAQAQYVTQLLDAMKDTSEYCDSDTSSPFVMRWAPNARHAFAPNQMEFICWKIVEVATRLHTFGPTALEIFDDETLSIVRKTLRWTFAHRIDAICTLLRRSKHRCTELMKGDRLSMTVGNPQVGLTSITKSAGSRPAQAQADAPAEAADATEDVAEQDA